MGLSLALAISNAQAGDFYVSTNGSDANPGTAVQPFRTITHADSKAEPGLTIHVAQGIYRDYTSRWEIRLNASGTASRPIVLRSDVRGGAAIEGENATNRNQGFYIDGSYNTVDGFEIRNAPNGGIAIYGNGNRIIANDIHSNGNPPSSSLNGKDGVYSNEHTRDNYYAGNSIHDNGRAGSNLDHGLYLCGENEIVINNLLFRNAACGLQVAGYRTVRNMKAYNNVMAFNGTDGMILWMTLKGVDIKNNIFCKNAHYALDSCEANWRRGGGGSPSVLRQWVRGLRVLAAGVGLQKHFGQNLLSRSTLCGRQPVEIRCAPQGGFSSNFVLD